MNQNIRSLCADTTKPDLMLPLFDPLAFAAKQVPMLKLSIRPSGSENPMHHELSLTCRLFPPLQYIGDRRHEQLEYPVRSDKGGTDYAIGERDQGLLRTF